MKIKNLVKLFNYFYFINFLRQNSYQIKNLLFFKAYNKKRIILRNSFKSKSFFNDIFNIPLKIKRLRKIFFNKNLFSYSNNSEKKKIIRLLKENCPTTIKKYLEYANKILNKEFSIFEKNYKFNNEINWHYSFFDNYIWRLEKSENINVRPKNKSVDVKYIWEFNRHQHLTYLGFAYYVTNEKRYANEFKAQVLDWIKKIHLYTELIGITV